MKHIVWATKPVTEKFTKEGVSWAFSKQTGEVFNVSTGKLDPVFTPQPTVYHEIVDDSVSHVGAVYCAQWDGVSEKLEVLVGDPKDLTHKFLGWPDE